MKRDITIDDVNILKELGYSDKDINKILNTNMAYKAKSFPEQYLAEVLTNNYSDVIANKFLDNGMEIDILINDINTGIEYSGSYFHTDKERDDRKRKYIESLGIRLITITELRATKVAN